MLLMQGDLFKNEFTFYDCNGNEINKTSDLSSTFNEDDGDNTDILNFSNES